VGSAEVPEAGAGKPARDARQESAAQRDDRNLSELIQELRVAGLGVQVLFGFLLSLPFTSQFDRLSGAQRDLYLVCVVLSATATALLIGPVAYHRLVFRRGMKERLVLYANRLAILGLAAVALAVLSAVLLVIWFVAGAASGWVVTALVGVVIATLWFAVPLASRRDSS
jgi:MFS family permease